MLELTKLSIAFVSGAILAGSYVWNDSQKDMADLRLEYETQEKYQAERNQKESEENAKKLAQAISERDEALANAAALSADASRVREQAASFGLRMPSGSTDSCEPCQQKLAESVRLLSEGSGLLAEGAELLNRVAADKDALAKIATKK